MKVKVLIIIIIVVTLGAVLVVSKVKGKNQPQRPAPSIPAVPSTPTLPNNPQALPPDPGDDAEIEPVIPDTTSALVHPGLVTSLAELEAMRQAVLARDDAATQAVQAMLAENRTDYKNHAPQAAPTIVALFNSGDEPPGQQTDQISQDGEIAYGAALLWYIYRDPTYAEQVLEIVNDWSGTFVGMQGDNTDLHSGTAWPAMVWAAEIIRYTYDGVDEVDMQAFEDLLLEKVYPLTRAVDDVDRGKPGPGNYQAWGIASRMSIAVFADDEHLFNQAVADYKTMIDSYVLAQGQPQELCRGDGDLFHTQMGMMPLLMAATIAEHQGVTAYSYRSQSSGQSLLDSFEYVAPFVAFDHRFTDRSHWPCAKSLGEHPLGYTPWPGWDQACSVTGGNDAVQSLAAYARSKNGGADYFSKLGWTTLTHACY